MTTPKSEPAKEVEKLPTATIKDRVGEFFFPSKDTFEFIFTNPQDAKFCITGNLAAAMVIHEMADNIIAQAHTSDPKRVFVRPRTEASIGSTDEIKGGIVVRFNNGMAYAITFETALEISALLTKECERIMSEADWMEYRRKKPLVITPKQNKRIIMPGT